MAPFFATVDTAIIGRKALDAALRLSGGSFLSRHHALRARGRLRTVQLRGHACNLRRKLNHLAALLGRIPESPLSQPVWYVELDYFCHDPTTPTRIHIESDRRA